jgi:hypothetical protein
MVAGWSQRFGGLEQTRLYIFLYIYPQMEGSASRVHEENGQRQNLRKLFSTQNTFAGAIIPSAAMWAFVLGT